jgi:hypothetical protein
MDYPTSDLQSFAARVKRLERHNLILKLLSAVTLVLLSALFAFEIGTRQSSPPDTIVTTHLVLRDKAGHDGAELSFDKDGKAALHLFGLGADQGVNATLSPDTLELHFHNASTSFSDGGLFMFDGKGNQIIGLGTPLGAQPVLRMWGSDRREIWLSALEPGPTLGMSDDAGFEADLGVVELITPRTGQQHKTSAASLTLFSKDRKVLWSTP